MNCLNAVLSLLFVLLPGHALATNVIDSIFSFKNGTTQKIRYTVQTRYYESVKGQTASNWVSLYDTLGRVILETSCEIPSAYSQYGYDDLGRKIHELRNFNGDKSALFYHYGAQKIDSVIAVQYNVESLPAEFNRVGANSLGQYVLIDPYSEEKCVYDSKTKTYTRTSKPTSNDSGLYCYFIEEHNYCYDSMNRLVVEEGPVGSCTYIYKNGRLYQEEYEVEGILSVITYNENGRIVLSENFEEYYPEKKLDNVCQFEYKDDKYGHWIEQRSVSTIYHSVETVHRKIVYY